MNFKTEEGQTYQQLGLNVGNVLQQNYFPEGGFISIDHLISYDGKPMQEEDAFELKLNHQDWINAGMIRTIKLYKRK